MVDSSKKRILCVHCHICDIRFGLFDLPPNVIIETEGKPGNTKFKITCPDCGHPGIYPFDDTFEIIDE